MQRGFAIPLILILASLGVITAFILQKGLLLNFGSASSSLKQENTDLKRRLDENEKEIKALVSDTAQSSPPTDMPFSFREFGIWSPLLENKATMISEYKYKRAIIRGKSIRLKDQSKVVDEISVVVWEFQRQTIENNYPPQLFTFSYNSPVDTDQYRLENCKEKYVSQNETHIEFCSVGSWAGGNFYNTLGLFSHQSNSPTNNRILIEVSAPAGGITLQQFNTLKSELRSVADQLFLYPVK